MRPIQLIASVACAVLVSSGTVFAEVAASPSAPQQAEVKARCAAATEAYYKLRTSALRTDPSLQQIPAIALVLDHCIQVKTAALEKR